MDLPAILVTDDRPELRYVVGELLTFSLNVDVEYAWDGESTLAACERRHFDLLVLDLCLPDGTGVQVARQLRARSCAIPVLFVTGHPEDVTTALLVELKPAALIAKPVSRQDLLRQVRCLCALALPVKPSGKFTD